jgi:hypothetical protein
MKRVVIVLAFFKLFGGLSCSVMEYVTGTFVANNITTGNGYVADIVAQLGVKSYK